jgi:hypothetical protein
MNQQGINYQPVCCNKKGFWDRSYFSQVED